MSTRVVSGSVNRGGTPLPQESVAGVGGLHEADRGREAAPTDQPGAPVIVVGAASRPRLPQQRKKPLTKRLPIPLLLALLPVTTTPAELLNVDVKKRGDRYHVSSESKYQATPEALFAVLLDYDNFTEVSSVFTESRYIEPTEDGTLRAYTKIEGCVVFFCTEIERIDQIFVTEYEKIVAESEPNPADFVYSRSEWVFEIEGEETTVHYKMVMEPGFWVPPIVGSYLLKRRLKSGAADTIERVERLALGQDPGD